MAQIVIDPFEPSDMAWVVSQHQRLYTQAEGFDDTFGPLVQEIIQAFAQHHDPAREAGWIARQAGQRVGCIFCVAQDAHTAKLRLFLVLPQARGSGLGRQLLTHCMGFARDAGYTDMQLWTHESHLAACALYARTGWTLTDSKPVRSFGRDLVEQTWRIRL